MAVILLSIREKIVMLKRLFDFILSLIGIIGSAPLWILFALAIKLEDRGPVFYTQSRVGKGGRIVQVYRRWEVGSRKADRLSY